MKKFTIQCNFGGTKAPFTIYVGGPKDENHPIQFQAKWLADERGGNIPAEVMEGLTKIKAIAQKNGVDFEELCAYALQAAMVSNQEPDKALQNKTDSTPSQPETTAEQPQQMQTEQSSDTTQTSDESQQ